jgi:hypothetical protein
VRIAVALAGGPVAAFVVECSRFAVGLADEAPVEQAAGVAGYSMTRYAGDGPHGQWTAVASCSDRTSVMADAEY